jgi:hypothetical protein
MIQNLKNENEVATKQISIERFSVISAKTFAEVASAIAAQVGHPDIQQFYEAIQAAEDDQELERVVNDAIGPSDLMEFIIFGTHGAKPAVCYFTHSFRKAITS